MKPVIKNRSKFKSKQLIVKHNNLIEARYRLNLIEIKLVAKLASSIQNGDTDFNIQKYKVSDLLQEFGLGISNYDEIKKSVHSLIGKVMVIKKPTGELHIAFLSSAEYFDKQGIVELSFDEKLKPYYLQLKKSFTAYHLENILKLKSFYSIRIYELVKQYENTATKERIIELIEFKEILGIQEKYEPFRNLKHWVLLPAQKEIIEKTDIIFQFEPLRECRKITKIRFYNIQQNKKQSNKLQTTTSKTRQEKLDNNTVAGNDLADELFKHGIRPKTLCYKLASEYPEDYIQQHIKSLQEGLKNNKIKSKKSGAWLHKAITSKSPQEILETEKEQQEQAKKEKEQKKKEVEQAKKEKAELELRVNYDKYLHQQSENYIDGLPKSEIKRLEKLFLAQLKNENNDFIYNRCRKRGVINCKNDFLPWIAEKYLEGKILSFADFKN